MLKAPVMFLAAFVCLLALVKGAAIVDRAERDLNSFHSRRSFGNSRLTKKELDMMKLLLQALEKTEGGATAGSEKRGMFQRQVGSSTSYPTGSTDGYSGTTGGYSGSTDGYSGSTGGYGGSTDGYSGSTGGYGGSTGGYSGSTGGYGGSTGGYSGSTGGYGGSTGGYSGSTGGYGGSTGGYPTGSPTTDSPGDPVIEVSSIL
ncbi:TATA-binding protein-associated factor 2N [Aplysia californica]|uniref:TATA-binding protein-associated factor 2N n=1 Tax=Aplysia californica TaxID=6500 RepID=A0ABM0K6X7_APLCA|nr:TATA-binding protein-associated factor 2N [Aplysia californica]